MKKSLLVAVAMSILPGTAFAAPSGNSSSADGSASATVVAPIVLTHNTGSLNFGKFTAGTGGTVVVTAAGAASATSDVGIVPGSTSSADSFGVSGDASRSFSISTLGGSVTAGTASMTFTTTPSASTGTLNTSGTASFTVGGTLTVPGSATAGSYTGTYTATVAYN